MFLEGTVLQRYRLENKHSEVKYMQNINKEIKKINTKFPFKEKYGLKTLKRFFFLNK